MLCQSFAFHFASRAGDGWSVKETRESGQSPAESATSDLILYYSSFHLIFHYPYIALYKPRIVIASIVFSIIGPIVASISSSIIPVLFLSVRLSSLRRALELPVTGILGFYRGYTRSYVMDYIGVILRLY